MNSCRGDLRQHHILRWYHVNKYRAMKGNQSELAPGRKSPRCHVNTPYEYGINFNRRTIACTQENACRWSVNSLEASWKKVSEFKKNFLCQHLSTNFGPNTFNTLLPGVVDLKINRIQSFDCFLDWFRKSNTHTGKSNWNFR